MDFDACRHLCLRPDGKLTEVDAVLVHRQNSFHNHGGNLGKASTFAWRYMSLEKEHLSWLLSRPLLAPRGWDESVLMKETLAHVRLEQTRGGTHSCSHWTPTATRIRHERQRVLHTNCGVWCKGKATQNRTGADQVKSHVGIRNPPRWRVLCTSITGDGGAGLPEKWRRVVDGFGTNIDRYQATLRKCPLPSFLRIHPHCTLTSKASGGRTTSRPRAPCPRGRCALLPPNT